MKPTCKKTDRTLKGPQESVNRAGRRERRPLVPRLKSLPDDFSMKLLSLLCEELCLVSDSYIATRLLDLSGLARNRDVTGLYEADGRYGLQCINRNVEYQDPYGWRSLRLCCSLLRKNKDLNVIEPKLRSQATIDRFIAVDRDLDVKRWFYDSDVFKIMRDDVALLLGEAPSVSELFEHARHGPGTSIGLPSKATSAYEKYVRWPYRVSKEGRSLLVDGILEDERWHGALEDSYRRQEGITMWSLLDRRRFLESIVSVTPYNVVGTVPKDSLKDRPIATEPTGSMFMQLAVDAIIRRLMRDRWDIDLNSASWNHELACKGSLTGTFATVDLSDASDTVSWELIKKLLPADWLVILNKLRSPCGLLPDGTGILYRKLSSMGNGYTFVIESLVFSALIRALFRVGRYRDCFAVYGDDLIIPCGMVSELRAYLTATGFRMNESKSFFTGPVRESCGKDYYRGCDIRPVFMKSDPIDVIDLVALRNRLRLWWLEGFGDELPQKIESFLLQFYDGELLTGPTSVDDAGCWYHTNESRFPGKCLWSLGYRQNEGPVKDFLLGRLSNQLRSSVTEGSLFGNPQRRRGALVVRRRVLAG